MFINQFYTLEAAAEQQQGGGMMFSLISIVLMIAIFYFIGIRPQKKQEKETKAMRDSLRVGNEITTIGGIIGKIVNIREDVLIIETGADRTKMKIARWAVQKVNEEVQEAKPATFKVKK